MIKLGRSQRAVYDWLKKQEKAQTAWDVGNALYEDISRCSLKNSRYGGFREWPEEKIHTSWASKVLRELVKRKVVWPDGVCGRAMTYKVIR